MALARREFTVVDEHGDIVTDAQVEVRSEIAGQPLVSLYSDRDGTTPIGNPFSVDPVTAVAAFHVVGGAYRIRAFSGSFERIERYVGIGTAAETDAGLIPTSISIGWNFDDATADADPGSGLFRLNHATPASATAIYIDNENAGGNSVTAWLDSLDDYGDSAARGTLTISDPDQPTEVFRIYFVSGTVTDGTGYRKLTVSHIAGAGSFSVGTQYSFDWNAKGTPGDVPSSRNLTAGTGLTGGGDLSADRTFALANMVQATLKGRAAGAGTGAPADLTASEVRTILGTISSVALQVFTGSDTYTPTSGMKACLVISTGAGGGGGGADSDGGSTAAGGGGGAGSTCIELFDAATIGAGQTVTIGAGGTAGANTGGTGGTGGTTTFGALHSAGGGAGGVGIAGIDLSNYVDGGAGGTATNAALNITGGGGTVGMGFQSDVGESVPSLGGNGGASFWGGGPAGPIGANNAAVAGINGTAYGSGGSGARNTNTTAGAAGGVGAAGVVIVLEFIA